MKKLILIFTVLLLNSNIVNSQDYWEQINTPPDADIRSIAVNSLNHIYVGMDHNYLGGGIYHTIDMGNNWEYVGLENNIYDILINDSDHIYTCSGWVFYSNNYAGSWDTISEKIYPGTIFTNNELILVGVGGGDIQIR